MTHRLRNSVLGVAGLVIATAAAREFTIYRQMGQIDAEIRDARETQSSAYTYGDTTTFDGMTMMIRGMEIERQGLMDRTYFVKHLI